MRIANATAKITRTIPILPDPLALAVKAFPSLARGAGRYPGYRNGTTTSDDIYTHGHQEAVLRSHRWRTAANSAGYLVPHLHPGLDLLDVGCGPGTITLDLAGLVAPGRVVGVDRSQAVIEEARATAERSGGGQVDFHQADVYALDLDDESFEVVHAHQVLQHLSDPVRAVGEMRRVLRPGGLLAVRDSDYAGFIWSPEDPALDRWLDVYHRVCRHNGAEPDAGRHLARWVRSAGFEDLQVASSTWTFADPDSRRWWGELWAERVTGSSFADQARDYGVASEDDLRAMSQAWRRWAADADGFFAVIHVEVLARR
jgi:ubiquinone/menaquinone biosynthesis C-methylase UbiE